MRTIATKVAWSFLGVQYCYLGSNPLQGFDCAGFVCEILRSVGLIKKNEVLNEVELWEKFKHCEVDQPYEACLFFCLNDLGEPYHVGYCLDGDTVIDATSGKRGITTLEEAAEYHAYVKARPLDSKPGKLFFVDPFCA